MPKIHLVPISEGITQEELFQRMQHGWILSGRQMIRSTQKIVDVSKPMARVGAEDMDVWVLPEPMIPMVVVAEALVDGFIAKEGQDTGTVLDDIARFLLGQGIIPLALARKQGESDESEQTDDPREAVQTEPEVEEG